ncbi:MAG: cupin domain-containing protein [Patescibacteria group bacterium]
MTGYIDNIEKQTLKNNYFRKVIYTGQHEQVVLMSLEPKEAIGMEVHEIVDQFLRIEKGEGKVVMNGEEHSISDGSAIVVPTGTKHNIINTSSTEQMKLYTVYAPPHHKEDTVHKTKAEADADKEDHL